MKPTAVSRDALQQALEQRDWIAEQISGKVLAKADQTMAYVRDVSDRFGLETSDAETICSVLAAIYWMVEAGIPIDAAVAALLIWAAETVEARKDA